MGITTDAQNKEEIIKNSEKKSENGQYYKRNNFSQIKNRPANDLQDSTIDTAITHLANHIRTDQEISDGKASLQKMKHQQLASDEVRKRDLSNVKLLKDGSFGINDDDREPTDTPMNMDREEAAKSHPDSDKWYAEHSALVA